MNPSFRKARSDYPESRENNSLLDTGSRLRLVRYDVWVLFQDFSAAGCQLLAASWVRSDHRLELSSPTATLLRGAPRSLDLRQLPVEDLLFLGIISEPQRFLEMKLGIA